MSPAVSGVEVFSLYSSDAGPRNVAPLFQLANTLQWIPWAGVYALASCVRPGLENLDHVFFGVNSLLGMLRFPTASGTMRQIPPELKEPGHPEPFSS